MVSAVYILSSKTQRQLRGYCFLIFGLILTKNQISDFNMSKKFGIEVITMFIVLAIFMNVYKKFERRK
jgi:hypothetical protein